MVWEIISEGCYKNTKYVAKYTIYSTENEF